jgi:hypothetical protein
MGEDVSERTMDEDFDEAGLWEVPEIRFWQRVGLAFRGAWAIFCGRELSPRRSGAPFWWRVRRAVRTAWEILSEPFWPYTSWFAWRVILRRWRRRAWVSLGR